MDKMERLTMECFCAMNNGGMEDLLLLYDGQAATEERQQELVDELAEELLTYNRQTCGAVQVEGLTHKKALAFARQELTHHLKVRDGVLRIVAETPVDAVRWEALLAMD